jgi:hypothetical protein
MTQYPLTLAACEAHREECTPDLSITDPEHIKRLLAGGRSGGEKGPKRPEGRS